MFVFDCFSLFFIVFMIGFFVFFFKQKTAYDMRISDWSSDVCSSDLGGGGANRARRAARIARGAELSIVVRGGDCDHRPARAPQGAGMVRRAGRRRGAAAGQGIALAVADRVRRRDRAGADRAVPRSEERGVGREWVSKFRSRGC